MKKIELTIKTEKTYTIEIDENIIDQEIIDNFEEYFQSDVKEESGELALINDEEVIKERDFPYFNLAKYIAYNIAVNDDYNPEGLPLVRNTLYDNKKDSTGGIYATEQSVDHECSFDLDQSEL